MIVIIADDFSGAAELAGIAASRGYKAEVQMTFEPSSNAEVIAVDTDTRLKPKAEAARIVYEVTKQVHSASPAWIYKKTDSVLRGHVHAEIDMILKATGLKKCLLIPANPSKGRVIINGRYLIDDIPLHETIFGTDPDHPRSDACVKALLGDAPHIAVPDVASANDLNHHVDGSTLAAGGADFFSRLIGGSPVSAATKQPVDATLLLCGSLAAWDSGRSEEMTSRGFEVRLASDNAANQAWPVNGRVMLALGPAEEGDSGRLTQRLVEAAMPLYLTKGNLRVALEGGATAVAFMRHLGWHRFDVIPEGITGVGSLRPEGGPPVWVKPGSYPWPEGVFD
jgi:uncharacterized protein YgbK (DUF1537 family)